MNSKNTVEFPSSLETVALMNWKRGSESGCLECPFPNGAGFWRIEGNRLLSFEFAGDFVRELSACETLAPSFDKNLRDL